MTWQATVISNTITVSILLALLIIIYCRVTKKTLGDVIRDVKEAMSAPNEQIP